MAGSIGERIAVLKQELGISSNRELEKGGLSGDDWIVSNGLIAKWEASDPEHFSTSVVERFLNHYKVNRDWWKTGKGEVFLKNGTHVETPSHNTQNGVNSKETFYRDIIEDNEEYSLIPRAVLRDYKIVPDKIIDVLVQSNENEKKALIESKELEIRSLNEKYETLIQGYENKIKRLEKENEDLRRG